MRKSNKQLNEKLRYNIITVFIYIIGITLLVQLFNLQIVHGEEYLETSNIRLTRESVLKAARGNITDNSGTVLAGTTTSFNLEIYKSKIDNSTLNQTLLRTAVVLEQNNSSYIDNFPIKVNPFEYIYTDTERQIKWKKSNKLNESLSAEEVFYEFKKRYEIQNDNIDEVRKIIAMRYQIASEGYSATKSVTIAQNISIESVHILNEQNDIFPGINVVEIPVRSYPKGTLASHILGYTSKISKKEYNVEKNNGYTLTDYYGKSGIERIAEKYIKGTDGIKQIDMAVDGTITGENVSQGAIRWSKYNTYNRCKTTRSS